MRVSRFAWAAAAFAAVCIFNLSTCHAVELLTNGGLEDSAGPQGWTLTQSITGMPGSVVSAAEHVDSADIGFQPSPGVGGLGLLIKPFAGNEGTYADQNKAVNVSLSQTVPVVASKNYTFTGHSFYQIAAPNNLDTLFADSPSGAVPSPTQTTFKVEFLNASDTVLGSQSISLPKNRPTDANPADWQTHSFSLDSPAGTTKARVTASATEMVASCTTACPGGHDVYFDDFSLVQNGLFGGEKLTNGNLNALGAPAGFTIEKTAQDNLSFGGAASFAANSGSVGMWLRAFAGGDAKIIQTLPASAGGQYTFSAYSKWETGYSGANPFPPSGQTQTSTFMKMEFLNASNSVIGTQNLDLFTVQSPDGTWRPFSLNGTAPAGTTNVRVSAGAANMYNTTINPQSAFFDDFSLTGPSAGVPGDYNGNHVVDAADYVLWRNGGPLQNEVNTPGVVDNSDYTAWRARFGNTSGAGSGNLLSSGAVPEPTVVGLSLLGLAAAFGLRRRS